MSKSRCTAAETEARTDKVLGFLLDGCSRAGILQYSAKNWGLSARQTDTLIARAKKHIEAIGQRHRGQWLGTAVARLERLLSEVRKTSRKDFGNAAQKVYAELSVVKELHKIQGLYPKPSEEPAGGQEELAAALAVAICELGQTQDMPTPEEIDAMERDGM